MIANIQNAPVQMLCMLALDDESTLTYPLPDQIFGFHAQQTCEKLFKALIASHGIAYPLTHDLAELMKILVVQGETLPPVPFDPFLLIPYAVQLRYQYGVGLTDEERQAVRETIVILREYVVGRILELER